MSDGSTTLQINTLLAQLQRGDAAAAPQLLAVAHERLMSTCRRLLNSFASLRRRGEETGDVLHGAFERLVRSVSEVKPDTAEKFFGLAAFKFRQQLLDRLRKLKVYVREHSEQSELSDSGQTIVRVRPRVVSLGGQGPNDDHPWEFEGCDIRPDQLGSALDLLEALEGLPDDEKAVVEMLFWYGLTQEEAAQAMKVDPSTIKRRWARARVKLAGRLGAYEIG